MPKRTNDFQQLIAFIEGQLAPKGATVTESAMLEALDGSGPAEVDVLIELKVGEHTVRMALECRDHKRKQSVTWIEQLEGRYRHLPVDKVIAVTRTGYSKTAYIRAQASKITPLTLREALKTEWPAEFSKYVMGLMTWHQRLRTAYPTYSAETPPSMSGEELRAALISDTDGSNASTFEQDVVTLYRKHSLAAVQESMGANQERWWAGGPGKEWDVTVPFTATGRWLAAPDEMRYRLAAITLILTCRFELTEVNSRRYVYNEAKISAGTLEPSDEAVKYSFTMLHNDDGSPLALQVTVRRRDR